MSTQTEKPPPPQGLSVTTLVIASLSSIAAAIFIHKFWTGGAILGAGITPIIVAVVSESLKKPTRVIQERRQTRPRGASAMRGAPDAMPVEPTEVAPPREDRFGIWEDDRRGGSRSGSGSGDAPRLHRIGGRRLKLAIATGVAAFVVGAFLLTGAELVFGGGGSGGDRLTIVPGKQDRKDRDDRTRTTETSTTPAEEQVPPAPGEQPEEAPAPTETAPPAVPTTPQTVPPPTTTPAPQTPVPPTTVPGEPAPAG